MVGQMDAFGAVLKLNRAQGNPLWIQTFPLLATVTAYAVLPATQHIVGCGYLSTDKTAGYFKIQRNGVFKTYYKITPDGTNTVVCSGITYNSVTDEVTLLLNTNMIYASYGSTSTDSALVVLSGTGSLNGGSIISLTNVNSATSPLPVYSLTHGYGTLFLDSNANYYFGGHSVGFATSLQENAYTGGYKNVMIFKYKLDKPNNYGCLYE